MKAQYDNKPTPLAKHDAQGRYLFRFNIEELIIPANDLMPETVMWQCDEVVLDGDLVNIRNELKKYIDDAEIDVVIDYYQNSNEDSVIVNYDIIITEPIEPTRFAQFTSLEAYNAVNRAIAAWKDQQTAGEYTRTQTEFEYNPQPDEVDGFYYMEAKPEYVEAGLFEGVVLFDAIPAPRVPDETWLKADIQAWLTANNIEWRTSWTKDQLLSALL